MNKAAAVAAEASPARLQTCDCCRWSVLPVSSGLGLALQVRAYAHSLRQARSWCLAGRAAPQDHVAWTARLHQTRVRQAGMGFQADAVRVRYTRNPPDALRITLRPGDRTFPLLGMPARQLSSSMVLAANKDPTYSPAQPRLVEEPVSRCKT